MPAHASQSLSPRCPSHHFRALCAPFLQRPARLVAFSELPSSPPFESPVVCTFRELEHTTLPHSVSGPSPELETAHTSDQRAAPSGGAGPKRAAKREPVPKRMGSQDLAPSEGSPAHCHPASVNWPPCPPRFPVQPIPRPSVPSKSHPREPHPGFSIEPAPNPIPPS